MKTPRSIVFWDHYFDPETGVSKIGGIERLIANLTMSLGARIPVKVIAYEDSVICKILDSCDAIYHRLEPASDLSTQVRRDDLHISFGTYRDLIRLRKPNPRILLWKVYPHVGLDSIIAKTLYQKLLVNLNGLNSLVFMDNHCREITNRDMKICLTSPLLRLPIEASEIVVPSRQLTEKIRITYVGRGNEVWKVKPVKKLLSDLSELKDRKFEVHVFTDTDELFVKELASVNSENVEIYYHFGIYGEDLRKKLRVLSDLHYSMGTAALEGAALGIPTIIADGSYNDFPDGYRYRWLKDDIDNYAGMFINHESSPTGSSINTMIQDIEGEKRFRAVSLDTLAMVQTYFSLEKICEELMSINSQARVSNVLRLMPYYWMSRFGFRK